MKQPGHNDLDFLGALLHGRRSQLMEGKRLDALCHLQTVPELGRNVYPETEFRRAAELQRRLGQDLLREQLDCLRHLEGVGADLLVWMVARFQVENVKVLIRGMANQVPFEELGHYLVPLPHNLGIDIGVPRKTTSLEEFIAWLPPGNLRGWLRMAATVYREQPRTFFLEAALDRGYIQELLARAKALPDEEREAVESLVLQEADTFQLMLALRGRFHYGLKPELLLPLHVPESGIPPARFSAMCADPDPFTAAARAVGRALDALPSSPENVPKDGMPDLAMFEALAWKRFLRLANRAFRRSHMGLGAVVGYLGIRRVEVANLITISEAIRSGLTAGETRARLIPRQEREAAYV